MTVALDTQPNPQVLLQDSRVADRQAVVEESQKKPVQIVLSSPQTLKQGQIGVIAGTDIRVSVLEVRDFTSAGCLGGPVGCPDHVRLEVSRGSKRELITLYRTQVPDQKNQPVKETVFDYVITVARLREDQVTLVVTEKNKSKGTFV